MISLKNVQYMMSNALEILVAMKGLYLICQQSVKKMKMNLLLAGLACRRE